MSTRISVDCKYFCHTKYLHHSGHGLPMEFIRKSSIIRMKEFEEAPNMLLKLGIRDDVFRVLRLLVLKVKNGGSCNMRGPSHGILRFRTQSVTEKGR